MSQKLSISFSRKPSNKPVPKLKSVLPHMVLIDVVVLKSQLLLSETEICFTATAETSTFLATNVSDEPLNLVFRYDEAYQSHFVVAVKDSKGTLTFSFINP